MSPEDSMAVMLYDGDCGFCQYWIDKWGKITRRQVRYEPYQKALAAYPQVTEKQCTEAVQLVLADGQVFSGAHAVFKALVISGRYRLFLLLYEHATLFAWLCEWLYQLIAGHRSFLSRLYRRPKCRI